MILLKQFTAVKISYIFIAAKSTGFKVIIKLTVFLWRYITVNHHMRIYGVVLTATVNDAAMHFRRRLSSMVRHSGMLSKRSNGSMNKTATRIS